MPENKYLRQSGIIDIKKYRENRIGIVGCGSIGSFLSICLSKMGLTKFTLWDFDNVKEHNLPNQFFMEKDIGRFKSNLTKEYMERFNKEAEIEFRLRFNKTNYKKGCKIIISCVDNMDTRKDIFECCKMDKYVQLFIDARMGGLQGQVYFIDMTNKKEIKNYEKTLFSNKESVQLRCTERSIIFTVLGIVSLICCNIVKALKGEEIKNYVVIDYEGLQII